MTPDEEEEIVVEDKPRDEDEDDKRVKEEDVEEDVDNILEAFKDQKIVLQDNDVKPNALELRVSVKKEDSNCTLDLLCQAAESLEDQERRMTKSAPGSPLIGGQKKFAQVDPLDLSVSR